MALWSRRWFPLLLALPAFLWTGTPARAHRLDGEYRILPGGKICVESWFDLTGDSPPGAKVQAFRDNGELLVEGKLDEKGSFIFSFSRPENLRIVILAGPGHRKELTVRASELSRFVQQSGPSAETADPQTNSRVGEGRWLPALKDMMIGVGFLLAVAAFFLSWRNARRLKQMERDRFPRS